MSSLNCCFAKCKCAYIPTSVNFADVDECQINGSCPEHSTCANTFGSFVCTCNEGFTKNGSVCIGKDPPFFFVNDWNHCLLNFFIADVDECQLNGTCPEHSTCANTFGSFVCTCNEGFMRNGSVCIGKNYLWPCTNLPSKNYLSSIRCWWMWHHRILSRTLHLCKHLWLFCMYL